MSARAMQHACRSLSESSSTGRLRSVVAPVSWSSVSAAPLEPLRLRDCVAMERIDAEPEVVEDRARRHDQHLLEDGDDPEVERLPR